MSTDHPQTPVKGVKDGNISLTKPLLLHIFPGKYVVDWICIILVTAFLICAILYCLLHSDYGYRIHGTFQIPTLSLTGALPPGSIVFTLALHLAAMYLAFMFTAIYLVYGQRIETITYDAVSSVHPNLLCVCKSHVKFKESLRKWNYRCLVLGWGMAVFMFLTGSISLDVSEALHSSVAFLMFACAVLHMIAFYNNVTRYMEIPQWQAKVQRAAYIFLLPLNIVGVIVAAVVVSLCQSDICWRFAVDLMPSLEFSTCVGLFLYAIQFRYEIASVRLVMCMMGDEHADATADERLRLASDFDDIITGKGLQSVLLG